MTNEVMIDIPELPVPAFEALLSEEGSDGKVVLCYSAEQMVAFGKKMVEDYLLKLYQLTSKHPMSTSVDSSGYVMNLDNHDPIS